jgi:hypothetical protein
MPAGAASAWWKLAALLVVVLVFHQFVTENLGVVLAGAALAGCALVAVLQAAADAVQQAPPRRTRD